MGEKYYWVLGFCCGFIAVVIVTVIIANIKRKRTLTQNTMNDRFLHGARLINRHFLCLSGT